MAQRYPRDFDGIFSRVPVINWTGLQLAGTRNGIATMGDAWLKPAQVKLVHDAVLKACDASDGIADGLVSDAAGCKARFDLDDACVAPPARAATRASTTRSCGGADLARALPLPFPFANGVTEYPGWGISGENTPAAGPTGGWIAWWLGAAPPTLPPAPNNSIAWVYGSGAVQYFYARDPQLDVRRFDAAAHAARLKEVSALMDSTDPDLGAFAARGGKLLMLEYMADYAQSPYAGIEYYRPSSRAWGRRRSIASRACTPRRASITSAAGRRPTSTCSACSSIGSSAVASRVRCRWSRSSALRRSR